MSSANQCHARFPISVRSELAPMVERGWYMPTPGNSLFAAFETERSVSDSAHLYPARRSGEDKEKFSELCRSTLVAIERPLSLLIARKLPIHYRPTPSQQTNGRFSDQHPEADRPESTHPGRQRLVAACPILGHRPRRLDDRSERSAEGADGREPPVRSGARIAKKQTLTVRTFFGSYDPRPPNTAMRPRAHGIDFRVARLFLRKPFAPAHPSNPRRRACPKLIHRSADGCPVISLHQGRPAPWRSLRSGFPP